MKLGEEAGVSGTPTLFVGTERVSNPTDFEAVSKEIDAKLAN
jgi:protein-disulfide isomerase